MVIEKKLNFKLHTAIRAERKKEKQLSLDVIINAKYSKKKLKHRFNTRELTEKGVK